MRVSYFLFGLLLLCTLAYPQSINAAGDCCYKDFSATTGIAGESASTIEVTIIDPRAIDEPTLEARLKPLANEKIEIHVGNPQPGQKCKTLSGTTDMQGKINAECTSEKPGPLSVYFTAPNLSASLNSYLDYQWHEINFEENVSDDNLNSDNYIQDVVIEEEDITPVSRNFFDQFIEFIKNFIARLLNLEITPSDPQSVACTMEAKQCPDGSFVGRVPPTCEFAPCPGE